MKPRLVDPSGEWLMDIHDMENRTRLSKTKVMELVEQGKLPQPKKLGSQLRWRQADFDAVVREMFTAL